MDTFLHFETVTHSPWKVLSLFFLCANLETPNENNHPETFQEKESVRFPACTGPEFKEESAAAAAAISMAR